MSDTLNVEIREETGTLRMRRLRKTGVIPAVLYGHGEGSQMLTVQSKELGKVIRAGNQVVTLTGGATGTALLKDIQWDPMGSDVLHLDLTRVKAGEAVEITIPLEIKGDSPGAKAGGTVRTVAHDVAIECPADKVVEKIEVNINALELGQSITAADLDLPEGATPKDPSALIVQCVESSAAASDEAEAEEGATPAEPEVIGRKSEDEESE